MNGPDEMDPLLRTAANGDDTALERELTAALRPGELPTGFAERVLARAAAQRSQFAAQRSEFETQRSEFETQRSEFETQHSEFDLQRREFDAQRGEFETQRSEFETQRRGPEMRPDAQRQDATPARLLAWPARLSWMGGAIAAALIAGLLGGGFALEREHLQEHRAAVATAQFQTAERIEDQALAQAREQVERAGVHLGD